MSSKLLEPVASLLVRGSILIVILALAITLYYASPPTSSFDEVYRALSAGLGVTSISPPQWNLIIQIMLIGAAAILVVKDRLTTGLIKGTHLYVTLLLAIYLSETSYILFAKQGQGEYTYYIIYALLLLIANIVLWAKYPPIAITAYITGQSSRKIIPENKKLELSYDETLEINVMGKEGLVEAKYDENNVNIERSKTLLGEKITIKPLTMIPSEVRLMLGDKNIASYTVKLKNSETIRLKAKVFFNDDMVDEKEIGVEKTRPIITGVKPLVEAVLSRLGLNEEDVRSIQIYTGENVNLDPRTPAGAITAEDISIRIYSVEKHLELLKYYRVKDVFDLWDKLMHRLQYLNNTTPGLMENARKLAGLITVVADNWW